MEAWRYRELYDLEDRHWWFRSRRRAIWALLHRTRLTPGARLLDAGCGTGRNLVEFGGLGEAEGVDPSEHAVAFCHERGLTGVRRAPAEELPYEAGRFDLVLATDVVEHLADDVRALTEMRRVAAPGAHLLLTVPAYGWLWTRHDVSMHHHRRYTARRLEAAARAAGWRPEVRTYFFATMLPAVALVRGVRKLLDARRPAAAAAVSDGDHDAAGGSDLDLTPGALNRLLEVPMRAEARLIAAGVALPAGVSLGLVCVAA